MDDCDGFEFGGEERVTITAGEKRRFGCEKGWGCQTQSHFDFSRKSNQRLKERRANINK